MTYARLAALLLCFAGAAHGDEIFDHPLDAAGLNALLEDAGFSAGDTAMQGCFEQRKHLADLPAPLLARGRFLFARDHGLLWDTLHPFESRLVVSAAGVWQQDEGDETRVLATAEQPAALLAAQLFIAMFAMDAEALTGDFHVYGRRHDDGWQVGLRPRDDALAGALTAVTISGAQRAEHLAWRDVHGDRTEIDLLNVKSMDALDEADAQRFEPPR
jgi:hypothetical protein